MPCTTCKKQFSVEPHAAEMYAAADAPMPQECSTCLAQRQLAFFPFGKFRKGRSDLTGATLFTTFPENARFPIYTTAEWHSDAWEPPSQTYNASRSFFEQFAELQASTPRPHLTGIESNGCDWCDDVWDSKNCYLCRSLAWGENLSYGYRVIRCRDSLDIAYSFDLENSYDCTYCFRCYNVRHAFDSRDSQDSVFLYDCRNVRNCFMCWNLRNKEYCIKNKPYTKEAYLRELATCQTKSRKAVSQLRSEFVSLIASQAVHKPHLNTKAVESRGNYLVNCKRCVNCYFTEESEHCTNIYRAHKSKEVVDTVDTLENEKCFVCSGIWNCFNARYVLKCIRCRNIEYCDLCTDCEGCFGCVGLHNKRFCIFNSQYTEPEYRALVSRIKEAMRRDGSYGQFFPYNLAYTGYNLSVAHLYFPKTRQEVAALGGLWTDMETGQLEGSPADTLPDNIDDVPDAISAQPLLCEKTGWRYNIASHELVFLKKHGIPAPTQHPDVRFHERFKPMTYVTAREVPCFQCNKSTTTYWPESLGYQHIACEACYNQEVA